MGFTTDQLATITTVTMISSALSALGSLYLIITIWRKNSSINSTSSNERFLFMIAVVSLIGSTAFGQSTTAISSPARCLIQGSLIEFTVNALPLLGLGQAISFWMILSGYKKPYYYDWAAAFIAVLVPTIFVLYCLGANVIGDSIIWCWIVKSRTDLRYILFYALLWVNVLGVFVFTFMGVRQVFKAERNLANVQNKPKQSYRYTANACKAFFYGLAFVVVWTPGSTNRLYETINGSSPFAMVLMHTMFTPLEGFINAVVYFILSQVLAKSSSATHTQSSTEKSYSIA